MAGLLKGKRALAFVDEIYEDLELWYPKLRLEEEGAEVLVAGKEKRRYTGKHGYPCDADMTLNDVRADLFDILLLPGGFAPDQLRRYPQVLETTRWFHAQKRLIAFICHAGWIPISAGICRGIKCTSTPGIKDDLVNAGATWIDEPCVIDGHLVSARRPPDLPAFCQGILSVASRTK